VAELDDLSHPAGWNLDFVAPRLVQRPRGL